MIVDCAWYHDGVRQQSVPLDEVSEHRGKGGFIWIGLHEPSEDELATVASEFDLHELAVEDARQAHQRPKLEVYDDSLFIVLHTAHYIDESETVDFGEIQVFVGEDHVVVVRHGEPTELASVRQALEADTESISRGPSAVLHAVVDRVVDDYFPVIAGLDNDITEVETDVFAPRASANPVERIYKLKREVLGMRRAALPLLAPLEQLADRRVPMLHESIGEYFRDVHDHLLRVRDQVDTFDDLLSSVLEANLTRVSVQQNEDMRKISAWVAIAAVPTLLAGIYGMNFEYMPELDERWGYPSTIGFMVVFCFVVWMFFRKRGWL